MLFQFMPAATPLITSATVLYHNHKSVILSGGSRFCEP